jgi:uncharacterized glyoxalase superfamily protein PhnB
MTPVLRYRNPGAAARWLCEAFGFHEQESAQESDQHVKYILLRLGDSGVLVRPVSNSVFDDLMLEPSAVGGGNTHVLYLPIGDAEQHCARAKAAGATGCGPAGPRGRRGGTGGALPRPHAAGDAPANCYGEAWRR